MEKDIRPDVESLLSPLKSFQRRTVEYAFRRMYLDAEPAHRFLVADEVGLGKTLIARGVIAKVIDHLWQRVERIDVVYVCSNAAIARQNIRKLAPGVGHEQSLATRLTLLPRQLKGLTSHRLNFVSLTPATSFDQGSGHGAAPERAILYQLLASELGGGAALKNLLRGSVQKENWDAYLERRASDELDESLSQKFLAALHGEARPLLDRVEAFLGSVGWRQQISESERKQRRNIVGDLRALLARTCVDALEPDLVVLDEFQRFKHLLSPPDEDDETAALARTLFTYTTPEHERTRILLLSATPYKMYSTDGEAGEDDHYPDFIATTRFLMDDDEERVERFEEKLRAYRLGMMDALQTGDESLLDAKRAVESELRRVMVRTERVAATVDRQAMVDEPALDVVFDESDVQQYLAVDAVARALGEPEPIELWKSAPYLVSFMSGYKLKRELEERLSEEALQEALRTHAASHLSATALKGYQAIDPGNARLRRLIDDMVGGEGWRLLWVPPSLPYWAPQGPFASAPDYSKALVFSAWNVVPDVVSALVSYEVERRALASRDVVYERLSDQVSRRLEFKVSDGRLAGMPVLALQYPSKALGEAVDPIGLYRAAVTDPVIAAREQTSVLVERLRRYEGASTAPDERWYWAAPVLLDVEAGAALQVLVRWPTQSVHLDGGGTSRFDEHLARFREAARGELDPPLGRMPEDLAEVLAELALGAPGICAFRASRWTGVGVVDRQLAAVLFAEGMRALFNQPTAIPVVEPFYEEAYWRATLHYSIAGNLQALLDEYLHQVWEQGGWSRKPDGAGLCEAMREMADAAQLRTSRVKAKVLRQRGSVVALEGVNVRADFARRYGKLRSDDDSRAASEVAVRTAFNSPFRPFVLASTSVGQEGLDFHPWCHVLYHWNLPGNPVDLEQREGRVHRYKGHAVRRNVAARFGGELRSLVESAEDPWQRLFALAEAAREEGDSELVPHWLFDGERRVERRVPVLPFSKDAERLQRLRRELAAYRLVFGQPRQQELLELLKTASAPVGELERWAIDLRPPAGGSHHEASATSEGVDSPPSADSGGDGFNPSRSCQERRQCEESATLPRRETVARLGDLAEAPGHGDGRTTMGATTRKNLYRGTMTREEALEKLGRAAERMGIRKKDIKLRRVEGAKTGMRLSFAIEGAEIVRECSSQDSVDANLACLVLWLEDMLLNIDRGIETFREAFYAEGGDRLPVRYEPPQGTRPYKGAKSAEDSLEVIERSLKRLGLTRSDAQVTWGDGIARIRIRLKSGRILDKSSTRQVDARTNLGALALWLQGRARSFERGIEQDLNRLFAAYLLPEAKVSA